MLQLEYIDTVNWKFRVVLFYEATFILSVWSHFEAAFGLIDVQVVVDAVLVAVIHASLSTDSIDVGVDVNVAVDINVVVDYVRDVGDVDDAGVDADADADIDVDVDANVVVVTIFGMKPFWRMKEDSASAATDRQRSK